MGPKTKGKGAKKAQREAVGPSASAESTQPKVRQQQEVLLSGVPDYFDRNKISSGGDLSHYSSASLY